MLTSRVIRSLGKLSVNRTKLLQTSLTRVPRVTMTLPKFSVASFSTQHISVTNVDNNENELNQDKIPADHFPWRKDWKLHEGNSLEDLFVEEFDYPPSKDSLTRYMTGAYVDITEEDLKLLPEGFISEDMKKEFEMSSDGIKRWMIRDSGKFCCRFLDYYKAKKAGHSIEDNMKKDEAYNRKLIYEGLTDRPEWIDATLGVEYYNKQLLGKPKNSLKASGCRSVEHFNGDIVKNYLEVIKESELVPDRIMLTGARGVGKSISLAQTVLHARNTGWLVLYIPNGWAHVQGGSYVQPALIEKEPFKSGIEYRAPVKMSKDELVAMAKPVTTPTDEKTIFDNHEMSADALRGFLKSHREQLRQIPIRDVSIMNKYAPYRADFETYLNRVLALDPINDTRAFVDLRAQVEGDDSFSALDQQDVDVLKDFRYQDFQAKTLEDLALLGVALRELSGSLFIDLVNELKVLDRPDMPVLIAVDGYNTWELPSAFAYNNQSIHAKQLCVPHILNFLTPRQADSENWSLANGMCIGATSLHTTEGKRVTYENYKASVPLTVTVPHYNAVEFLSAASHFTEAGFFSDRLQLHDLLSLRMFTGSNPRLVREQGFYYLLERMGLYHADDSADEDSDQEEDDQMEEVDEETDSDEETIEFFRQKFGYTVEDDEDDDDYADLDEDDGELEAAKKAQQVQQPRRRTGSGNAPGTNKNRNR